MSVERETVYRRFLAHQNREHLDRCLMLPWGGRQLALCARCSAVYPALLLTLGLLLWLPLPSLGWIDTLWVLMASAPAIVDWGLSRLGAPGSNRSRVLTGAALGVALGRSFSLYLVESRSEVFWIHAVVALISVVSFEIVRALDLGDF